jgi:3-phenylpropionate/cinnamic acid dioxygenase small subunit
MFHLMDSGRADETPTFVTDDVTVQLGVHELDRTGFERAMKNRAEASHISRHCLSNLRVLERDDESVTVAYITAAHRREPEEETPHILVGDCEDEWVHGEDGWRLRRRVMTASFPPPTDPTPNTEEH